MVIHVEGSVVVGFTSKLVELESCIEVIPESLADVLFLLPAIPKHGPAKLLDPEVVRHLQV